MKDPLLGRIFLLIFRPSIKSKIKAMTKFQKNSLVWFVIYLVVLGSVILSTSSCRAGYGCRGNQSWGKMVSRINRP